MRPCLPILLVSLLCVGASAEEEGDEAAPVEAAEVVDTPSVDPTTRILKVSAADVGRLALRNDPRFQAAVLAPEIVRTFEQEADAEFEALLTSRAGFTREQSEIFFRPAPTAGGNPVTDTHSLQDTVNAGAEVSKTEQWGGSWRLNYTATSRDDRGAASINTLSPRYTGTLSLGYVHPLLRGAGSDVRLLPTRTAKAATNESELQLYRNAEIVVSDAESAFWELVGRIADVNVRRKSVDVANELLSVTEARLASGRGTAVDVTEARAGLARRQVDLIAAENVQENAADRLRARIFPFTSTGADLDIRIEPTGLPPTRAEQVVTEPPKPNEQSVTRAILLRSDVRSIEAEVEAARYVEKGAEDQALDVLDAIVGGTLAGRGTGFSDSSDRLEDRDEYDWSAQVEWIKPLGNKAALARLRRATMVRRQIQRELTSLKNEVIREVRVSTRNVTSAARQIEASVRAFNAATEQLEAETSRLRNGRSTPFKVLQVEEDLTTSDRDEIRARIEYEIARVGMLRAQGVILKERGLENLVYQE